jgi:hypothetical protein
VEVEEEPKTTHVSVAPSPPTVLVGVAVAQALTRESAADVHVYVAPVAAPSTAVHLEQVCAAFAMLFQNPSAHAETWLVVAEVHVRVAAATLLVTSVHVSHVGASVNTPDASQVMSPRPLVKKPSSHVITTTSIVSPVIAPVDFFFELAT